MKDAWEWLRNPLPPAIEDPLFATLRLQMGLPDQTFFTDRGFGSLGFLEQQAVGDDSASVEREEIKAAVKKREVRLVVATDAACEGLNLQTLGTLIKVDLPWNPSRLEQRLGRIKRFGHLPWEPNCNLVCCPFAVISESYDTIIAFGVN